MLISNITPEKVINVFQDHIKGFSLRFDTFVHCGRFHQTALFIQIVTVIWS